MKTLLNLKKCINIYECYFTTADAPWTWVIDIHRTVSPLFLYLLSVEGLKGSKVEDLKVLFIYNSLNKKTECYKKEKSDTMRQESD